MDFINEPIKNEADAQGFLFQLHQLGMAFHPEDDPAEVINSQTGLPLFTPEQAEVIRQRMDEVYEVMDDPCQYVLDLTGPASDEERSNGPSH